MSFKVYSGPRLTNSTHLTVQVLEKTVEFEQNSSSAPKELLATQKYLPSPIYQALQSHFAECTVTIQRLQNANRLKSIETLSLRARVQTTRILELERFKAQTMDHENQRHACWIKGSAYVAASVTVVVSSSVFGPLGGFLSLPLAETVHDRISMRLPFGPTEMEILERMCSNVNLSHEEALRELLAELVQDEGFDFALPTAEEVAAYIKAYDNSTVAEALRRLVQIKLRKAKLFQAD